MIYISPAELLCFRDIFRFRNRLFWCCSQWLDWYNVSKLL